jgi:superfamily I DNA/RNA helicase
MALDTIDQGAIEPFDCLIIDEGQDLIRPEYLDVFDALLKGGLAGGNWEIYCDLERQAIYSDLTATSISNLLKERANFASFRLRTNCRNTRPIGEETSLLSGFETPPFLPSKIEGLPVDYYFYKDETEKIQKLEKILQQLHHQNISPANITILSPNKFDSAGVAKLKSTHFQIHDITKYRATFVSPDTITFSTIHSFKGLENSYIILIDISRLDNDEFKSFLYVGMSRARVSLCLLLAEQSKKDYDTLLKKRLE